MGELGKMSNLRRVARMFLMSAIKDALSECGTTQAAVARRRRCLVRPPECVLQAKMPEIPAKVRHGELLA